MLDLALKFLTKELNSFLLVRTGSPFGEAELGRLVDDAGKWAIKEDQLGISLIHVEEERILKAQMPERTLLNGQHVVLAPPLRINLHIMVAANFKRYEEALRYLALVLTYFQSHPSFTSDRYPGLDPRLEKLNLELLSLGYEQLNQIWAFIGAKQLPSVVYKVRMVVLQDPEQMIAAPVSQTAPEVHSA
jgi:hypothetical protein